MIEKLENPVSLINDTIIHTYTVTQRNEILKDYNLSKCLLSENYKPNSKALSELSELVKYLLIIMCGSFIFNNG